jgi:hydroxyethylthiazole kinase-like sugar kinase family protein
VLRVIQVTDGSRTFCVDNGVPMLCDITATGCSVTALVAGYVAANPENPLLATASALSVFGFVLASSLLAIRTAQAIASLGGSTNAALS